MESPESASMSTLDQAQDEKEPTNDNLLSGHGCILCQSDKHIGAILQVGLVESQQQTKRREQDHHLML
jgi:hypothetical protein